MPTVQHNSLTGAELHEPKGISGASANESYVANGAGSGTWTEPEPKDFAASTTAAQVYISDGANSGALGNITEYAAVYTQQSDSATLGSIGTTAQTFQFTTNGPDKGAVADQTNNRITLTQAGDYKVEFTASFNTTAAGDAGEYEFTLELDGGNTVYNCKVDMSGTSDLTNVVIQGILTATAGQQLTVEIVSDEGADSDDIVINSASLTAVLLK